MSCKNCKNYSSLEKPRKIDEYITIHGYCFKKKIGLKNTGYPVYLPEGKCKEHIPLYSNKRTIEGQMNFDDFSEVMP